MITWPMVACLAVAAATGAYGAHEHYEGLIAFASTIVGGLFGMVLPNNRRNEKPDHATERTPRPGPHAD